MATPAAAVDCFPKMAALAVHRPAPHRAPPAHRIAAVHPVVHHPHRARRTVGVVRPKPAKVAHAPSLNAPQFAESSRDQQTIPVYAPRPVSCDDRPIALLQAAAPRRPETPAQMLLDALAGPLVAAAPPADVAVPEIAPALPSTPEVSPDFPGFPVVGSPGGGPLFPGGGTPGGGPPPVTPPDQPPVAPPVTPPDQPPVVPPDQPPVVPPVTPPDQPPPVVPPEGRGPGGGGPGGGGPGGGGPGGPGGVPEPATWAMLMLGFAAVGGTLRSRRRTRRHTSC